MQVLVLQRNRRHPAQDLPELDDRLEAELRVRRARPDVYQIKRGRGGRVRLSTLGDGLGALGRAPRVPRLQELVPADARGDGGYSAETGRGDAAATTWIVRGETGVDSTWRDGSRRRRGHDADSPWRDGRG